MSTGSRFITAAVAAMVVSVASAGFVVARRSASPAPVATTEPAPVAAAEPTPDATPSPESSPALKSESAAASPASPAPAASPAPETVLSKAMQPKARASTPAPSPKANAASLKKKPATRVDPPRTATRPASQPALEPVVETSAVSPTWSAPSPAAASSSGPPVARPAANPAPPPAPVVETAPVEAPKRQFEELTVKADSMVAIRLNQQLSSATAKVEDRVTAIVSNDLMADGRMVVPAGSRLEGTVTTVQPGSKFKGRARLGIRFHTLVLADGMRVPIQTEALYRDGESATRATATKVGTGAAAGAIIGGLLGGKRGAIIGGTVGAGGGTAAVMASDSREAVLESGSPLSMRLTAPVTITVERDPARR